MEHLSTLLQIDLQNLYVPPKRQDRNSDISHTDSIPYNGSLPFTKKFLTREETFNRNPQYQSKSYLPHQEEKSLLRLILIRYGIILTIEKTSFYTKL